MAKITRITTQKNNKARYNIFLDKGEGEQYGFSVDEDILVEYHLHKGLEIDNTMLETLVEKDSVHKIYAMGLKYLSYRMRSKQEMRDYFLNKDNIDPDQVEQVINRLVNDNLLNDNEFAYALVQTRINTSSKGPLLIKKELIDKGIEAKFVNQAMKLYSYEDQYDKVYKFVNKKIKTTGKKSFKQQVLSLKQTLIQKGFTQAVIGDVLSEVEEQKDTDAEWDAVVFQGEKFVSKYSKKAEGNELKYKVKAALYRKGFTIDIIDRFLEEYVESQEEL